MEELKAPRPSICCANALHDVRSKQGSSPIRVKMHAKDSIEPSGVDDSISANNVVR